LKMSASSAFRTRALCSTAICQFYTSGERLLQRLPFVLVSHRAIHPAQYDPGQ
jgi:hypothetical protein